MVVDVLSFTTSVTVAVESGTRVFPYRWRDATAATFADHRGADLAVGRRMATASSPWSLSPAALRRAPFTPRLVLPSPNGSAIAASAGESRVVAGALRNATAAAHWLVNQGYGTADRPVAVIASGERWPDGSLRPAMEDLLGAGAIIAALRERLSDTLSPEAALAAAGFRPHRTSVPQWQPVPLGGNSSAGDSPRTSLWPPNWTPAPRFPSSSTGRSPSLSDGSLRLSPPGAPREFQPTVWSGCRADGRRPG
ncbi:hypothetical protein SALBM311S_00664 [Streptomyces alboniger]